RSMACKLGSPITPLSPPPPATPAHVQHRIQAAPLGFAHSAIGFQPRHQMARFRLPALPETSLAYLPATASSRRKNMACTDRAHGRTSSPSARYAHVLGSVFATSSMPSLYVWSWRNFAVRRNVSQDGVG